MSNPNEVADRLPFSTWWDDRKRKGSQLIAFTDADRYVAELAWHAALRAADEKAKSEVKQLPNVEQDRLDTIAFEELWASRDKDGRPVDRIDLHYGFFSALRYLRAADEKATRLPEESLHKIAEIVRIHALYEGHPCHNKRHADSIVIAACGHRDDYVELTLGDCRALAAALEREG